MARPTDLTGKHLQPFSRQNVTPGAILISLGDRPRKKTAEILTGLGIHKDYIDDALKGKPYGAKVIDLEEYRWMRLFDEL